MAGDLEGVEDAVAQAYVDQDPGDEVVAEDLCDFAIVLGFADFSGDEGVEVGDVIGYGFVHDGVAYFGDCLQEDAVGQAEAFGRHWVFACEAAQAFGGVAGASEQVLPGVEGLGCGAFDERDEEVALACEVAVDDGFGDAGGFGELRCGRPRVALFGEEFGGDVEQLLFAFVGGEAAGGAGVGAVCVGHVTRVARFCVGARSRVLMSCTSCCCSAAFFVHG